MKKNLNIAYLNGAEGVTRKSSTSNGGSNVSLMKEVTYAELKELRDGGKLVAGQMYRMTDYETTTSQEGTQAAGHPFDLILTAFDEKTLDEKCSAIHSARDTEGYFANSNLPAWDVRYCLDNDSNRFTWAIQKGKKLIVDFSDIGFTNPVKAALNGTFDYEGTTYFKWNANLDGMNAYVLTLTEDNLIGKTALTYLTTEGMAAPVGTIIDSIVTDKEGKGVIYRMIDENKNDLPYDFKNIMYIKPLDEDGKYNEETGVELPVYTFNHFVNNKSIDLSLNANYVVYNVMTSSNILPENIILNPSYTSDLAIHHNTFINSRLNIFGNSVFNNTLIDCQNNKILGYYIVNNHFRSCRDTIFYDTPPTYSKFDFMDKCSIYGEISSSHINSATNFICHFNLDHVNIHGSIFNTKFGESNYQGTGLYDTDIYGEINKLTLLFTINDAAYIKFRGTIHYKRVSGNNSKKEIKINGFDGSGNSSRGYIYLDANDNVIQYTDLDIYNAINK